MTGPLQAARILGMLTAGLLITAGPGWSGTLRGAVRFAGAQAEPKKINVTVDHHACGTQKDAEELVVVAGRGLRNAVVSLSTSAETTAVKPAGPPVQMDQKQCVFVPRVVVVPAGGTVEFLNSDRLLHNLHSASKDNAVFNRTQPKGRTIPIVFKRPEVVRIDCDLHPWMRAWVVVADHPFYAVTGDQGEFLLENVPPGRYTFHVWHESLGIVQRDVTVDGGVATITVEMGGK
jgi:plastocyanin